MKRFLLSVALGTTLALTSCQFDDSDIWDKFGEMEESIRDHEQRISALEELCKQMNTNIEALQTLVNALEKRDYVTNISEVRSNGEVIGYTISFGKSDTITIYHGKDGKDGVNGADGKDGYTPQIGVMQDTDGIFYLTLDGEWLLDANGNKIKANATDGKDGITPLLKIENDYWFVSYDNGATWQQLGKATGEDGTDGNDGIDGDSIFKSVTEDEDNVYFTLADGTVISLPKGDKKTTVDDVCSLMEDITFMKYCYDNFDANKDGMLSQTEAASVYTIDISGLDIYSLTGIEMFTRLESIMAKNCTKLREVVIPNTISEIGSQAFYGCKSLTSITIPESVISIGSDAFFGCSSLTKVNIADLSTWCKIAFYGSTSNPLSYAKGIYLNDELITTLNIPSDVTEIKSYAFYNCKSLASVTIPDSVTSIGSSAFYGCSSLTNITIPDGVTSIGSSAFYGCTGELIINSKTIVEEDYTSRSYPTYDSSSGWLYGSKFTKLAIGDNITKIGNYAFYYWSSLTSVTIPNSVTSIGDYAFTGCTLLQAVHIFDLSAWYKIDFSTGSSNPLYYAEKIYLNDELITTLNIPSDVTEIKSYAFYNCKSLTSVTIPDSVTSIGSSAFSGCTGVLTINCNIPSASINECAFYNSKFTKVIIGNSVTSIGDYAFYSCSSLASIAIPESVTSIGNYAFSGCSSLTSIVIPDGITSIKNETFYGCSSLASITIPDSVTSIGSEAFTYCTSLTSVTIGNSVTSIGQSAFEYCRNLINVYCKPIIPPTGGSSMFNGIASGRKIYVPRNSVSAYQVASYWSNYASSIVGYDF